MVSPDNLLLITSLAPKSDRALQAAALASWLNAGVSVCSVNTAQEQELLRGDFPEIPFLTPERTAEAAAGKPVPFIHDMFTLAKKHDPSAHAFGILNDDIILRSGIQFNQEFLDSLGDAMILGPRVDIARLQDAENYSDQEQPDFSVGYDLITVPARLVDQLPSAPLALGMPFWDYWLPIKAVIEDWPLKFISDQALLHPRHETVWDETVFVFFHALATALLQGAEQHKERENSRFKLVLDILVHSYSDLFSKGTAPEATSAQRDVLGSFYDRFQEVVVHYIKQTAQPLTLGTFND